MRTRDPLRRLPSCLPPYPKPNLGPQRWAPASWPARARETPLRPVGNYGQWAPSCASPSAPAPSPQPRLSPLQRRRAAQHTAARKSPSLRARGGYGPRPAEIADAASASHPSSPAGRWRPCLCELLKMAPVLWRLPPTLDMLLHRLHRDRGLLRDRRLASSAVARGGCRRRAAAADRGNEPAATLGDAV